MRAHEMSVVVWTPWGWGDVGRPFLQFGSSRIQKVYYSPSMYKSQRTPDKLMKFVFWPCLKTVERLACATFFWATESNSTLCSRWRFCHQGVDFDTSFGGDKITALLRCDTVIPWPSCKEGSAQDAGGTCGSTFGTQRYQAEALVLFQQHDNMRCHVCLTTMLCIGPKVRKVSYFVKCRRYALILFSMNRDDLAESTTSIGSCFTCLNWTIPCKLHNLSSQPSHLQWFICVWMTFILILFCIIMISAGFVQTWVNDQLLRLNQPFQLRLQAWWRGQMARRRYAAVQEMLGDECGLLCWVVNVVGIFHHFSLFLLHLCGSTCRTVLSVLYFDNSSIKGLPTWLESETRMLPKSVSKIV